MKIKSTEKRPHGVFVSELNIKKITAGKQKKINRIIELLKEPMVTE